jgi:hypothetical protein
MSARSGVRLGVNVRFGSLQSVLCFCGQALEDGGGGQNLMQQSGALAFLFSTDWRSSTTAVQAMSYRRTGLPLMTFAA